MQFVDALDAWIKVEHELGKLFYVLLKPVDFSLSQSIFRGINGFQAQREVVRTVAQDRIIDAAVFNIIDALIERGRGLATKRNNLVHGRWRPFNLGEAPERRDLLARVYFPPNMRSFTQPGTTAYSLKGKHIFFADDLKRCEAEFLALAGDLRKSQVDAARALGVSPAIELTDEDFVEP